MPDAPPTPDLAEVIPGHAWRDEPALRAALEQAVAVVGSRPPIAERVLAAARAGVLDRGIARVTMSDVARRARISRTTLYRQYPDVAAVLRDLMTHDFGTIALAALADAVDRPTGRERLVVAVVAGTRELRADPLFRKVLDVDPEYLLPYVVARAGVAQRALLGLLAPAVAAGQEDGSIRAGDPDVLARLLLLQAQALTLSVATVSDGDPAAEVELAAAFGLAVDAQLRPVAPAG